jgi:hypothetical protein
MSDDADSSIKVSKAARERLGILAAERGTTIRGLVEDLAGAQLTRSELEARGEAARAYLRLHMNVDVSEDDLSAGDRLLQEMASRTARLPGTAA